MTSRKPARIGITDPAAGGVRDLVVDYDPVPFCQGTICALPPAACVCSRPIPMVCMASRTGADPAGRKCLSQSNPDLFQGRRRTR